jgi:hypothetical protein
MSLRDGLSRDCIGYFPAVRINAEFDVARVQGVSPVSMSGGRRLGTIIDARLVRTVKTDGWISTDSHSHSSPSGNNTSSQLGRVLNLLCEHIEFAACTEHNRLSTYDPHLRRLGAEKQMATCVGVELTGRPLPLNHQNAFPLLRSS